ncbi:amidohydrolase family protein [Carboxylicivirga sp. RSCT41]|uniref:amidohydrolase family protein n=1 Tax=Carboxylicivirga agarovorans TaxID=3417570 RepID=UPI003D348DE0
MGIAINNGRLIDPANNIDSKLNLLVENGKVAAISNKPFRAEQEIDATELIVAPGFVDIHIHEANIDKNTGNFETGTFESMLKMGVTTAIGGNCGFGALNPVEYLDKVDADRIPINLGMLLPHNSLREAINFTDKYKEVSPEQLNEMITIANNWLAEGLVGVSFGLRYVPGANTEEYYAVADRAKQHNRLITAHIRDDAAGVIDALNEFISFGLDGKSKMQVSHIGSMAAFGQMDQFLSAIDQYTYNGVDISCDCYPYYAFCVAIGRTTYDEGFMERYNTGYESIEILEGEHKNKRCTPELFAHLRKNDPDVLTSAHVMKSDEVDRALLHPNVMIASDGVLNNMQGHPRVSGTFPRAMNLLVNERKSLSPYEAVRKMTQMPAERLGINKGNLAVGKDADLVLFNLASIHDKASFTNPTDEPVGIRYVLVNGQLALENNQIINPKAGQSVRTK